MVFAGGECRRAAHEELTPLGPASDVCAVLEVDTETCRRCCSRNRWSGCECQQAAKWKVHLTPLFIRAQRTLIAEYEVSMAARTPAYSLCLVYIQTGYCVFSEKKEKSKEEEKMNRKRRRLGKSWYLDLEFSIQVLPARTSLID